MTQTTNPLRWDYPQWKAPAGDGEFLIWPAADELRRSTLANLQRGRENCSTLFAGQPLCEIRRQTRQFIGHDDALPLIATGHQVELHHPGVWAKNAMINALADAVGGRAVHLAVDTDVPKHLRVRWPGTALPITDDLKLDSAAWAGALDSPTPAHVDELIAQLNAAKSAWSFQPMLGSVLETLKRSALEPVPLAVSLGNAMHALDWQLGLRHSLLLASPLWNSDGFLAFVSELLGRAGEVLSKYNGALAEFRTQNKISGSTRPMPDLFAGDEAVEIPFWLDDLAEGTRSRPSVFRRDDGFVLDLCCGEEFYFAARSTTDEVAKLRAWLTKNRVRISPRALTLTLFVRLCLADQFVHGIGGGRYDQVTDRLITSLFGMDPPAFSVTTATLIFPEAVGAPRVCVPCVKREGQFLRHGLLGSRKRELIGAIARAPRKSPERARLFADLHSQLTAAEQRTGVLQRWSRRLQETVERERLEQTLFDRELFYAIQPHERLSRLIQQYASVFSV